MEQHELTEEGLQDVNGGLDNTSFGLGLGVGVGSTALVTTIGIGAALVSKNLRASRAASDAVSHTPEVRNTVNGLGSTADKLSTVDLNRLKKAHMA